MEREPRDVRRPPWAEFRAALEAAGFQPTKTRGQNFLLDGNMARAIARDAQVGADDLVLEVGPGCGFLSAHLLAAGVRLVAVEIDRRLLDVAAGFLGPDATLIHADVLAGKHAFAPEVDAALPADAPWHLVANLPYSISGPVLAIAAARANPPRSMTVLVQREVAERVAAEPGAAAWGGLSARLALRYSRRLGRRVPAALFWPRPRVESAVVRLELRDEPALTAADVAHFHALVDALFGQRRKRVLGLLAARCASREAAEAALLAAGADPGARPGDLAVEALLALSRDPAWRRREG
jgi:16S rRNA (adenine1518-N6/adenine1519-N6)-dimethyltransferase